MVQEWKIHIARAFPSMNLGSGGEPMVSPGNSQEKPLYQASNRASSVVHTAHWPTANSANRKIQLKLVLHLVCSAVSRHATLLRERENLKFKKVMRKEISFSTVVTNSGDWKAIVEFDSEVWIEIFGMPICPEIPKFPMAMQEAVTSRARMSAMLRKPLEICCMNDQGN